MIKRLWYFSLEVMEKLDRRKTFLERHGYKFARKIYDRAFKELYGMSPYEARDEHDMWQDQQEYNARMSEDGA